MVRTLLCTAHISSDAPMSLRINLPARWESKPLAAVVKLLAEHVARRRGDLGGYMSSDVLALSVKNPDGTYEVLEQSRAVATLFTRDEVRLEAVARGGADAAAREPKPGPTPSPSPSAAPARRMGFLAAAPTLGACCLGRCTCQRYRERADGGGVCDCGHDELQHCPKFPADRPRRPRFVFLKPTQGLCNRLRALASALFLAEDVEIAFGYAKGEVKVALEWVPDVACAAAFGDLFEAHPRIVEVGAFDPATDDLGAIRGGARDVSLRAYRSRLRHEYLANDSGARDVSLCADRLGAACDRDRVVKVVDALGKKLRLERRASKATATDALRYDVLAVETSEMFYPAAMKDVGGGGGVRRTVAELYAAQGGGNPRDDEATVEAFRSAFLRELVPVAAVRARVARSPPGGVGVHIRRTDNAAAIIHSPPALFDSNLERRDPAPRAVFLATDDPAVEKQFLARWSPKIDVRVSAKRTAMDGFTNRGDAVGVQDALVDLLSLAACETVVGSFWSSFSRVAALLGNVPLDVVLRRTADAEEEDLLAAAAGLGGLNRGGVPPENLAENRDLIQKIFPGVKLAPDPDDAPSLADE